MHRQWFNLLVIKQLIWNLSYLFSNAPPILSVRSHQRRCGFWSNFRILVGPFCPQISFNAIIWKILLSFHGNEIWTSEILMNENLCRFTYTCVIMARPHCLHVMTNSNYPPEFDHAFVFISMHCLPSYLTLCIYCK